MITKFPYKLIDLTHTLDEEIPTYDLSCGFKHDLTLDYSDCQTETKFRVQRFKMHAGIGTHIDAPAHCFPDEATVEALPLDELIAPAYCIDVSDSMDAEYTLSPDEILAFEKQHGTIDKNSFVIVYTGWSNYWQTPTQYHNNHKFPSILPAAAELLLKRDIVGIGIDTLSPDMPSSGFPVHQLILGAGKYIVENVANAKALPPTGSYTLTMPIKAAGATEAPVRLVGLV